jgi:2-dehydropantoate 2-reductase
VPSPGSRGAIVISNGVFQDRRTLTGRIAQDFKDAGIPADLSEDLGLARWQKLVWNVPMSGLSVVLACGHTIREDFPQKMIDMTLAMPPYHASMKIDFDQHKPMEVDAIYGNPVRRAHAAGGAMPLVETLYRQLMFLDARNCAGR